MAKQDKYTKSARNEECTVRLPGHCNFNPETTVLAHIRGGGVGTKKRNIHGAYCCSGCHDILDGRAPSDFSREELDLMHLEGVIRTQERMIIKGVLIL